ncbi:MAG TPA: Gfo/Idh/MocA family oxidoreductase [Nitrospiraceae bacterium]|nr:Gfo/Idh/MocA family oxidoreductase [Nitrospiraceae bacterium]
MGQPSITELGIGLVGVGRHGSRYVQHLLHDLPGVTLAAICRRRAEEPLPGAAVPVYSDYRSMIADPRVQAVVVVTPPSLCRDICLAAVRERKPVLIEKPLAMTGADARAMMAAANQANVLLMTAQTLRFDPSILLLREQLKTIGPVQSAILTSHIETRANVIPGATGPAPVGALLELGIHLLDLVRFLTGEEILKVQCTMTPDPSKAPEALVRAKLQTTGGVICALDIARVESSRVGTAEWAGINGTVTADWPKRRVMRTDIHGTSESWTVESCPTVLATLQAFVQAIRTSTPPPITGLDGCRAVEAADACYQSAGLGGLWVEVVSPI